MNDYTFVLKQNSEEIRNKIKDAGISVCFCTEFVDACWLDYCTTVTKEVHGVGFWGEENETRSQQEELDKFVAEVTNLVVCKDVDEFIAKILESKSRG